MHPNPLPIISVLSWPRIPRAWCAWLYTGLLVLATAVGSGWAAEPIAVPASLADLPNTANIHHQANYCALCHQTGPQGLLPSSLRFGHDYQAGCRCHYLTPGDLRHPTDVAVPKAMQAKIPSGFPLRDGQITCVSCHTFKVLCAPSDPHISSLRGEPYPDRTGFCFRCHEAKQYERLNPHNQLDASGRMVADKCLFCHTQKPDETQATYTTIKLIGGVEMLCQGCHNVGDRHPAGKPHMVRPTLEYQVRMQALERQYGLVLPLDENGKLTCITCHNPHDAGVIPKTLAGAKGAGEKLRHRLPKVLCQECHWHPLSTPQRK
jgi:hypothetical protein